VKWFGIARLVAALGVLGLSLASAQPRVTRDLYLLHATVTDVKKAPLAGAEVRLDDVLLGVTDSSGD
jgi:hypothetical protein